MYFSIKPLDNVIGVNSWNYSSYLYCYEGQPNTLSFQIVKLDKNSANQPPMRYMSQASVLAVSLIFPALNSVDQIEVLATQCFVDDKSIWKVALSSTQLPKSGAIQVKIVEDGIESNFIVKNAVSTELLNIGSC